MADVKVLVETVDAENTESQISTAPAVEVKDDVKATSASPLADPKRPAKHKPSTTEQFMEFKSAVEQNQQQQGMALKDQILRIEAVSQELGETRLTMQAILECVQNMSKPHHSDSKSLEVDNTSANRAANDSDRKYSDETKTERANDFRLRSTDLATRRDRGVQFTNNKELDSSRLTATSHEIGAILDGSDAGSSRHDWDESDRFSVFGDAASETETQFNPLHGSLVPPQKIQRESYAVLRERLERTLQKTRETVHRQRAQEDQQRDRDESHQRQQLRNAANESAEQWGTAPNASSTMRTSHIASSHTEPRLRGLELVSHVSARFNEKNEQLREMRSQTYQSRAIQNALLGRNRSNFGVMDQNPLLKKSLVAARATQILYQKNEKNNTVYIEKEANFKMKTSFNLYTLTIYMKEAIDWDARPARIPCQPGKYCSPTLLSVLVSRISNLNKHPELCADHGIVIINVPTIEDLKDMSKEEFYYFASCGIVPQSQIEMEKELNSCLDSLELKNEFYKGEQIGPQDKDRLELFHKERNQFILDALMLHLPQYSLVRANEDGSPKEMCTWPGFKPNTTLKLKGFKDIYFSGIGFQEVLPASAGSSESEPRTLKQAVLEDMKKHHQPSKFIPRLDVDAIHDVALAMNCMDNYNQRRKELGGYSSVLNPGEAADLPMAFELVVRHREHPGRLVLQPREDKHSQHDTNSRPTAAPSVFKPQTSKYAPAEKLERELRNYQAQARGEAPPQPLFWTAPKTPWRRMSSKLIDDVPKAQQRTMIAHLVQEELEEEEAERHRAEQEQRDFRLQAQLEHQRSMAYDHEDAAESVVATAHSLRHQYDTRGYSPANEKADRREYYEDSRDSVMNELAALSAIDLQQLPMNVRERVQEYRENRHESQRGGHPMREEHRHDGRQWQERRNSANHNPGRLYEPPKSVTFAQGNKNLACYKHLHNQCPHADNPDRCQWSHDEAICAAEAELISTVARDRKAKALAARKPAEKPAMVASIETIGQQTDHEQNWNAALHARQSADASQEE